MPRSVVADFRALALAFVAVLSPWASPAQDASAVAEFGFLPPVISAAGPEQVLFIARIPGPSTRVLLDFSPGQLRSTAVVDLRDDGQGGDAVAGDRTFTVSLPKGAFLAALRPDDVHVLFVGFMDVYDGTVRLNRLNVFASVHTPEVGDWPILRLGPTVQATSRVVNIVDPTASPDGFHGPLLRLFYQAFGDDYDFVNIVFGVTQPRNRFHYSTRNSVTGTGLGLFDSTALYGSAGRLQGINVFPSPHFFDGAQPGYIHELGHQWINFLNLPPVAQGIPHWPYSSMAGGVMGITIPTPDRQGGRFACNVVEENGQLRLNYRPTGPVYNDLELYLMGLLPPAQVRPQVVFDDQTTWAALNTEPCRGQLYAGAFTRLTVEDVIGAVGPRAPAAGAAQTAFRVATILVTRDGLASPEAMGLFSLLAARAEARTPLAVHEGRFKETAMPFHVATGGRGTLDTRLDLPNPGAPTDFAVSAVSGNTVTFSWTPPATGPVGPTSYVLEGGLTPGSVLGSLPIGGTPTSVSLPLPTGAFFVRLHALAGPQKGPASNEVHVLVNVPVPPSAPTNLLGLVNGPALALAWEHTAAGGAPTGALLEVTGDISATLPLGPGDGFQFPAVPPGTYTLAVRATNGAGASPPSNTVTLTFPGPCSGAPEMPTGFTAGRSGNTVSVSWKLPTGGPAPTSYHLHVSGAFNGTLPVNVRGLSGAVGPGSYTLSVSASNACGSSAPTPAQTVVVP